MKIVVDTSVIIAVIVNESSKQAIIDRTKGAELVAPASLHWEVANAFSAMFKRDRLSLVEAKKGLEAYQTIPLRFYDVPLDSALETASAFNIYAYDAYFLVCAKNLKVPLMTLDQSLVKTAKDAGVRILGVS